jgi:uncharacterized MAPEG superfamily protein
VISSLLVLLIVVWLVLRLVGSPDPAAPRAQRAPQSVLELVIVVVVIVLLLQLSGVLSHVPMRWPR